MIRSRKDLEFYIRADYMMNRGYFKPYLKQRMKNLVVHDHIMDFLVTMRKVDYYTNNGGGIRLLVNKMRYRRLSLKLGFSIGPQVFGYGPVIPHYGTIVVGNKNRIGNYCVLHTSICISDSNKNIDNALYVSTVAKITETIDLGNNITVGANTLVDKTFKAGNVLLVEIPATLKKAEYHGIAKEVKPMLNGLKI